MAAARPLQASGGTAQQGESGPAGDNSVDFFQFRTCPSDLTPQRYRFAVEEPASHPFVSWRTPQERGFLWYLAQDRSPFYTYKAQWIGLPCFPNNLGLWQGKPAGGGRGVLNNPGGLGLNSFPGPSFPGVQSSPWQQEGLKSRADKSPPPGAP